MPRIDDTPVEIKRPFKKKAYRPWNLMEDDLIVSPKETTAPLENHIVTNKESYGNQQETIRKPFSNQIVNKTLEKGIKEESVSNLLSNQISNPISNQKLSVSTTPKPGFYLDFDTYNFIQRVTGLQKKILFSIVENCILNGSLSTSPFSTESLAQLTNTDKNTIKTATQRLINKKLISRGYGKKGKGGFAIFCITEEVRNAVVDVQKRGPHSFHGLVTNKEPNKEPLSTYSSSNKINTTTSLPEVWKKINFELLNHIGFSETQLCQLYESNMTDPDIVQDAINRFAYSLGHNDKVKAYTDPLNVLMGVLRKGQRWNEPNYISPKELTLRQLVEEKRKQKEQHDAMIKELVDLEFPDWKKKLTDEEIRQIVPANILKMNVSAATLSSLRTYFLEKILLPEFEKKLAKGEI